jgi:hypothetical protein
MSIDKMVDKTDCNNCMGIAILQTTYKIYPTSWCQSLTPNAEEIIGDHQGILRRNRSPTDHVLCIRQMLEKNWNRTQQRVGYL